MYKTTYNSLLSFIRFAVNSAVSFDFFDVHGAPFQMFTSLPFQCWKLIMRLPNDLESFYNFAENPKYQDRSIISRMEKMPPKLRQFFQTTNWMGSASNVNRYITNDRAPMTSFHFTFRNIYFEWKLNTNRPKTNVHTSHCVNAEMEATLILFAFSEMSKYY